MAREVIPVVRTADLNKSKKGTVKPGHKYTWRELVNGEWVYHYPGDGQVSHTATQAGLFAGDGGSEQMSITDALPPKHVKHPTKKAPALPEPKGDKPVFGEGSKYKMLKQSSNMDDWSIRNLGTCSDAELFMLCGFMACAHSGNREKVIQRLRDNVYVRTKLREAIPVGSNWNLEETVDGEMQVHHLAKLVTARFKGEELKDLTRRVGGGLSVNQKHALAVGLVKWRNDAQKKYDEFRAKLKDALDQRASAKAPDLFSLPDAEPAPAPEPVKPAPVSLGKHEEKVIRHLQAGLRVVGTSKPNGNSGNPEIVRADGQGMDYTTLSTLGLLVNKGLVKQNYGHYQSGVIVQSTWTLTDEGRAVKLAAAPTEPAKERQSPPEPQKQPQPAPVAEKQQTAPQPAPVDASERYADDLAALQERLADVEKKIARYEGVKGETDGVAEHFHMGRVGGSGYKKHVSKLNRARERDLDRTIDNAVRLRPFYDERTRLQREIEHITSGRRAKREDAAQARAGRVRNAKVGDTAIDGVFGAATIIRVNEKSLTLQFGTFKEARPFNLITDVIPAAAVEAARKAKEQGNQ
jgi:hypothetical protein